MRERQTTKTCIHCCGPRKTWLSPSSKATSAFPQNPEATGWSRGRNITGKKQRGGRWKDESKISIPEREPVTVNFAEAALKVLHFKKNCIQKPEMKENQERLLKVDFPYKTHHVQHHQQSSCIEPKIPVDHVPHWDTYSVLSSFVHNPTHLQMHITDTKRNIKPIQQPSSHLA